MQIERVHKCALHVILGDKYVTYDQATKTLSVEKLRERRQQFNLTFAKKSEKKADYTTWFKMSEPIKTSIINTRGGVKKTNKINLERPFRTE